MLAGTVAAFACNPGVEELNNDTGAAPAGGATTSTEVLTSAADASTAVHRHCLPTAPPEFRNMRTKPSRRQIRTLEPNRPRRPRLGATVEPGRGLEPLTCSLRVSCSTD